MDTAIRSRSRAFSPFEDRCDRCGAAAMYASHKDKLELLWCGHDFTKHADKLDKDGWVIVNASNH